MDNENNENTNIEQYDNVTKNLTLLGKLLLKKTDEILPENEGNNIEMNQLGIKDNQIRMSNEDVDVILNYSVDKIENEEVEISSLHNISQKEMSDVKVNNNIEVKVSNELHNNEQIQNNNNSTIINNENINNISPNNSNHNNIIEVLQSNRFVSQDHVTSNEYSFPQEKNIIQDNGISNEQVLLSPEIIINNELNLDQENDNIKNDNTDMIDAVPTLGIYNTNSNIPVINIPTQVSNINNQSQNPNPCAETTLLQIQGELEASENNKSKNDKTTNALRFTPSFAITSIPNQTPSKKTLKIITNLKQQSNKLQKEIQQIEKNSIQLKAESYANIPKFQADTNKRNYQLKQNLKKHEILSTKLSSIKQQIDSILEGEKNVNRTNNIKAFLERIEQDHEHSNIYINKIAQYKEQSNLLLKKRLIDLNKSQEKKIQQKQIQDFVEKDLKDKRIEELKRKEHEVIKRRRYEHQQHLNPLCSPKLKYPGEYLFNKLKEQYEQNERLYLLQAKAQRKSNANSMSTGNIQEIRRQMKEHKILLDKQAIDKTYEMKEEWKNRAMLLPDYKSPFLKIVKNEEIKSKQNEDFQKIKVKIQRRDQVNYSKLKVPKVEINLKLKHERECNVCKLQRNHSCYLNRYFYENEELPNIKQSNRLSERNLIPSSLRNAIKDKEEQLKTNSAVNSILVNKKPKKLALSKSTTSRNVKSNYDGQTINSRETKKKINYLEELRKKNNNNNSNIKVTNWEKILNDSKGNPIENMNVIKNQMNSIEQQVEMQTELLKVNGGCAKNPEIADKISNLLIDSIQAKLTIMNSLHNKNNI